eukprot:3694990-Prymnesium_polylepis.1
MRGVNYRAGAVGSAKRARRFDAWSFVLTESGLDSGGADARVVGVPVVWVSIYIPTHGLMADRPSLGAPPALAPASTGRGPQQQCGEGPFSVVR